MLPTKTSLYIFLVSFFTSCNYNSSVDLIYIPTEKSQITKIKLADSLGNAYIQLPQRYDTSFSWTDFSDCGKPCDKIKYRWQPKILTITKESGWLWLNEPKDSIERFTISHSGFFPFHEGADSIEIARYLGVRKNYVQNAAPGHYKIKSDSVEKIGDRYFAIIVVDHYDSLNNQYCKKLLTSTTIKRNTIFFDFELLTKKHDSISNRFIENSKYYLRTVSIDKGM